VFEEAAETGVWATEFGRLTTFFGSGILKAPSIPVIGDGSSDDGEGN
jgi:hypothetical protein